MKKQYKSNQQGFIAFTSLLVVSVVVFAISLSVPLLGITEANSSLGFYKSQQALKLAESCNEEALIRLRDDTNYSGGTITVGINNCDISISGSGSNRTINVTATLTNPPTYIKKIQTVIKRTGNSINIISWQEI